MTPGSAFYWAYEAGTLRIAKAICILKKKIFKEQIEQNFKNMKRIILLSVSMLFSCMLSFATVYDTLPEIINTDKLLSVDTVYLLDGKTFVAEGAILTIEEGTRIEGIYNSDPYYASALVITRGSNIKASGTAAKPIVFTAHLDENNPTAETGDWGGLVILGYAPTNQEDPYIEGLYPPYVPTEIDCYFGGDDTYDDSGVLSYIRVEYAGASIATDNELNAFTFGGVGAGTTMDHLEAYKGADDGFEFFGGTVGGKYLLAVSNNDDQFDFDFGYQGNLQFLVAVLDPNVEYGSHTNGIECDNDGDGSTLQPYTRPVISNMTLASLGTPTTGTFLYGARWRRNSRFVLKNSIIYGFPTSIEVEGAPSTVYYADATPVLCDTNSYYSNNAFEENTCSAGFPSGLEPESCMSLASMGLTGPSSYDSIFENEGLKYIEDSYVASGSLFDFTCCNCGASGEFDGFDSVIFKGGAVDTDKEYWIAKDWVRYEDDATTSASAYGLKSTSGISETVATASEFSLLPNPAEEIVTISFSEEADDASISILSLNGQKLVAKNVEKGSTEVSVSLTDIESGIYFVVYSNNGYQTTKRLIKK